MRLSMMDRDDFIMKLNEKPTIPTVVVAACMDRISTLKVALHSWLSADDVSEVILVDWSSDPSILHSLSNMPKDSRLKIVTVQGEKKWILSWAYNLAAKFLPSDSLMLKVDCDTTLAPDFLQHHPLPKGIFYAGNWKLAGTENAKHLNGIFYIHSSDFLAVQGFDERIQTYGHDDTDLYARLNASGLTFTPIDTSKIYHLDHASNLRSAKQTINDVAFENEKNRIRRSFVLAWNRSNEKVSFHIQTDTNIPRHYLVTRTSNVPSIDSLITKHTRDYVDRRAAQIVLRGYHVPWKSLNVPTDYMIKMIPSYKKGRMLIVHAQHGLGSRLRAMASGMAISNKTGRHFRLIWQVDEHCQIRFEELFSNTIDVWDEFQSNETSSANFVRYNYMELEKGAVNGKLIETDTLNHIYVKTAYILNHAEVKPTNMHMILSELQLQSHIAAKVNEFNTTSFIGVHIRNADPHVEIPGIRANTYSDLEWKRIKSWRQASTISIFQSEIKSILKKNPSQYIFLSADSEQTINEIKKLFKNRILSLERQSCDDRSKKCFSFATADLWILSRSSKILGSPYSSFSEVAGLLGNITTEYAGIHFPYVESDHQIRHDIFGKGDGVIYMKFCASPNQQHYDVIKSVTSLNEVYKNTLSTAIFIDDDILLKKSDKHLFNYIYLVNNSQTIQDEDVEDTSASSHDTQQNLLALAGLKKIQQLAYSPFEITLYLDGDTWLCEQLGNFSKILDNRDILFSMSVHQKSKAKSSWNGGVILYRNSPMVIKFFQLWEKLYLQECFSSQVKDLDNCALSSALTLSTLLRYSSIDTTYSFRLGSETEVNNDLEPEKLRTQLIRWPVKILHVNRMILDPPDEVCRIINKYTSTPRILGLTSSNQIKIYYTKEECDKGTKNNCNTQTF